MTPLVDESRFIEALTRHQPVLEAFCHASLANRHDAREVLQRTNIKLWEKASDWNPDTEFLPWAFAVARFTLLSFHRDQVRERLVFDEEVTLAMADEAATFAVELPARREALGICLKKLLPAQRELLDAHYATGHSIREIAESSGKSASAIKMTLLRLREALSRCITSQLESV